MRIGKPGEFSKPCQRSLGADEAGPIILEFPVEPGGVEPVRDAPSQLTDGAGAARTARQPGFRVVGQGKREVARNSGIVSEAPQFAEPRDLAEEVPRIMNALV